MDSVYCETPFCNVKITQNENRLCGIDFVSAQSSPQQTDHVLLKNVLKQLQKYAASPKFTFDLPVSPKGTEFQLRVWSALQEIPSGQVRTYGELAKKLGSSARAVGNACRRNPIPLVIPCHRVVSAKGIGGFAGETEGQKISIKQQLLAHEGVEI